MTDDEVVKQVLEDNFEAWYGHSGEVEFRYETKSSPFMEQAARVHFNVVVFQTGKQHLANAVETVENWRAE